MTRLSVNINKVATIRNARGGNVPDLLQVAQDCQRFGAEGITIHPRPDERHIRFKDVVELKPLVETEYNIEGYPNKEWLQLVCDIQPDQATLVPDAEDVLTSNAGWNAEEHRGFLSEVIAQLQEAGCRVSLFMEADEEAMYAASLTKADRIELYTGPYADQFHIDKDKAVSAYASAALAAHELNLGINAGHDLDLKNLSFFSQHVPHLLEVSIGHALISDALYLGLEETISRYLDCLK